MNTVPLRLGPEVEDALATDKPVVALESTLISHGLPPEHRLEAAAAVEAAVRSGGAVPATIAIHDGALVVGADAEVVERLASGDAKKASLRDMAVALQNRGIFSTTVASTMAIAAKAGIRLFATGGIGGVHRQAELSFDESTDLLALAKYPVAVVSAGAKAVLDLPRTVERLETAGVPVLGYQTSNFPAFYYADSGLPVPHRFDTEIEMAEVLKLHFDALGGGAVVVQPPPEPLDPVTIEATIDAALQQAQANGVTGAAMTPFLLSRIAAATEGRSVAVNLALVKANARLAAGLAVALQTR